VAAPPSAGASRRIAVRGARRLEARGAKELAKTTARLGLHARIPVLDAFGARPRNAHAIAPQDAVRGQRVRLAVGLRARPVR
jgi:hypothetical protein